MNPTFSLLDVETTFSTRGTTGGCGKSHAYAVTGDDHPLDNEVDLVLANGITVADIGCGNGKDFIRRIENGGGEHRGTLYEFHKTELLYNAHRLQKPVNELAIVEGFASAWWMHQMGFPNVTALMGWSCSKEQARVVFGLVPPGGRVWIISDGDESGRRCAQSVFEQVAPQRFLQWLKLDEGKQPTDYPSVYYRKQFGEQPITRSRS